MPCAYCSAEEKLTREHIWPNCILKRVPSYKSRYSGRAGKMVSSDFTIRDVCRACNNGPLSELDAYFCELYDKYFTRELKPGQPITFSYDFDCLVKALLKISYNSARTTDVDAPLLRKYAPVIVSRDASPLGIFVKLATIHPTYTADRNGVDKFIPARSTRCGPFIVDNRNRRGIAARIIQIDSFRFHILATEDVFDRQLAVRYLANTPGTWLSRPGEVTVPEPTLSALQALRGVEHWRRDDSDVRRLPRRRVRQSALRRQ